MKVRQNPPQNKNNQQAPRPPACLGRSLEFRLELPAVSVLSSRVHSSNILQGVPKVFLVPSSGDGIEQCQIRPGDGHDEVLGVSISFVGQEGFVQEVPRGARSSNRRKLSHIIGRRAGNKSKGRHNNAGSDGCIHYTGKTGSGPGGGAAVAASASVERPTHTACSHGYSHPALLNC